MKEIDGKTFYSYFFNKEAPEAAALLSTDSSSATLKKKKQRKSFIHDERDYFLFFLKDITLNCSRALLHRLGRLLCLSALFSLVVK